MSALVERLARVRWLAVPIAAYLAITLGMPLANGAAGRAGFARHALFVLGGCGVVLAFVLTIDLIRRRNP